MLLAFFGNHAHYLTKSLVVMNGVILLIEELFTHLQVVVKEFAQIALKVE